MPWEIVYHFQGREIGRQLGVHCHACRINYQFLCTQCSLMETLHQHTD